MPLLDHFHPPLSTHRPWPSVHGLWAGSIARRLNAGLLPARFIALPNARPGGGIEIDVATVEEREAGGGTAVEARVWAPPEPPLVATADFMNLDLFEVRVFYDEGGPRLAAAIELVSPANKDRPASRRAFAVNCANYLAGRVAVVVVDIVTDRNADLHAELLEAMQLADTPLAWQSATGLSAVAYRPTGPKEATRLEIWPEALAVGAPLPTVPLWIADNYPVPLNLEPSYTDACRSLRIEG
jgi:hypothetical protein